jgi:hypothetical protein
MYEEFFIVSFWLKKHSVSDAASASAIGQRMQLISLQPLQHILDHLRGRAVFIACVHMLMNAHAGCETTFFNQNEMVENAQFLCQFNTTALTHVLASIYRIFRPIARTLRIMRTPNFSAFLLKYR